PALRLVGGPAARIRLQQVVALPTLSAPAPRPTRKSQLMEPGPLSVLVVDDEPYVLAIVSALLRLEGARPVKAADACDALALLAANPPGPDCALIDLDLRGACGLELCRLRRKARPDR